MTNGEIDPLDPSQEQKPELEARRRRLLISGVLITGLIAVAYSEPVGTVDKAINTEGVSIESLSLFAVYFLTVLWFFIGDILHLEEDQLTDVKAQVKWFWDMSFIVLECVILIFLGAVTSLEKNADARLGFFDLLVVLFSVDVTWITSMGVLNWLGNRPAAPDWFAGLWKRKVVPWGWAALNGAQLVVLLSDDYTANHRFSTGKLWLLVAMSCLAFVVDVFALNYYMKIKKKKREGA